MWKTGNSCVHLVSMDIPLFEADNHGKNSRSMYKECLANLRFSSTGLKIMVFILLKAMYSLPTAIGNN